MITLLLIAGVVLGGVAAVIGWWHVRSAAVRAEAVKRHPYSLYMPGAAFCLVFGGGFALLCGASLALR